jgi:hypothetical protein
MLEFAHWVRAPEQLEKEVSMFRAARALARTVDEAEIHFVHVVAPLSMAFRVSDVLAANGASP